MSTPTSTPTKDSKRCHVPSGKTPNEKKKSRPERSVGSRKSLDYRVAENQREIIKSPCIRGVLKRQIYTIVSSPAKVRSSPKKVQWKTSEDFALVQYIALHKDEQATENEWPAMRAESEYWTKAAKYIQSASGLPKQRKVMSVRQRVVNFLRKKYKTIEEAEDAFGLTVDAYLESDKENEPGVATQHMQVPLEGIPDKVLSDVSLLTDSQLSKLVKIMDGLPSPVLSCTLQEVLPKVVPFLCVSDVVELLTSLSKIASYEALLEVVDGLVCRIGSKSGLSWNLKGFVDVACRAMSALELHGKPNLVYFLCRCIAEKREDGKTPLLPMDRMPFGVIQYQLEFFNATNVCQIREPEDFRLWRETMEAEFGGGKFKRLFRGPMWSSCEQKDVGNPEKARVNIACVGTKTQNRRDQQSTFNGKPEVQEAALKQLKAANPSGRFWIKVDGTDLKPALLESMRKEWNGDVDLGNGVLLNLRRQYDERNQLFNDLHKAATCIALQQNLTRVIDHIEGDIIFLNEGLERATKLFREKMRRTSTSEETLRCLNWEVVEYQVLLEQSNNWLQLLNDLHGELNPVDPHRAHVMSVLKDSQGDMALYLRNIFKKKRQPAATHVLVMMVSDERRNHKPYALPVQYIPYYSLRDQYIRDFTKVLKRHMVQLGLHAVGTVSDGEFVTLRSRGETRSVHIWQLIHDAKSSVKKLSKQKLLEVLLLQGVNPDGTPRTRRVNPAIPSDVILDLFRLQHQNCLSLQDAVANIRASLVPHGHTP